MRISEFDYSSPADLYCGGSWSGRPAGITYRKFETAAEAIRYAVEDIPAANRRSCVIEVEDSRYSHAEVRRLYDSGNYPLPRKEGEETDAS